VVPEVDEESDTETCRLEIVVDLSAMFVGKIRHGFNLNNDLLEADEVRQVLNLQFSSFVALKLPKFSGRGFWLYETDSLSQRMLVEDLPSSEPVVGSITLASNR